MSKAQDVLREHAYDGIQEFDNPTPGWWTYIFIGTIFFSVVYYAYFHSGVAGRSVADRYQTAVAENLRLQFAEIGELKPDTATLLKFMKDPKWLTVGEIVFKGNCINCHGANASGSVGPNLTDDHWKNVKKLDDIPDVIRNGAANGAMPSWKNRLHPNEVVLAACYVASLRGQNLPGPRGAEGELIPPWPVAESPAETAPAAAESEP